MSALTVLSIVIVWMVALLTLVQWRANASVLSNVMGVVTGLIRWGRRLPRRVAELVLPPHIICPPVFEHLSLEQWRDNAKDFVGDDGLGWCGRNGKTVFEWLEARQLPPVPRDKYCPEKRKWVDNMERGEKEAYLKELRCQGA